MDDTFLLDKDNIQYYSNESEEQYITRMNYEYLEKSNSDPAVCPIYLLEDSILFLTFYLKTVGKVVDYKKPTLIIDLIYEDDLRNTAKMNQLYDSFRVGWVTIERKEAKAVRIHKKHFEDIKKYLSFNGTIRVAKAMKEIKSKGLLGKLRVIAMSDHEAAYTIAYNKHYQGLIDADYRSLKNNS